MSICTNCIHRGTDNCSDWEWAPPESCEDHTEGEPEKSPLERYIEELESDLKGYQSPASYQEEEWYTKCQIRAELLEDIIGRLRLL